MGFLVLLAIVLLVVFPVPVLIFTALSLVLIAVVAVLNALTSLLYIKPVKKDGPDPWAVACQPMSMRVAFYRLCCFMLAVLIAGSVTAAALAYFGTVAAGMVLLCVSGAALMAYVKTAA